MPSTTVVWRVTAKTFDPDSFIARFHVRNVDIVWRRGELALNRKAHETSGFNKHLGDFDSIDTTLRAVERFAQRNEKQLRFLRSRSVQSVVDVGVYFGGDTSTFSARVPHALSATLASTHLDFEMSFYPSTD